MSMIKEYAQDLAESMGYETINQDVLMTGQAIIEAGLLPPLDLKSAITRAMGMPQLTQDVIDVVASINMLSLLPFALRGVQVAKIARKIRTNRIITICAYCHKLKLGNKWEKVDYIPKGRLSHGICQRCYNEVMKEIK